ncbi:MAG TPA: hypothetical protein DF383_03585 [Deltaproteobacteria bacterium]|nr:hypothetical protein [Deltaproteobacteria bacterium]
MGIFDLIEEEPSEDKEITPSLSQVLSDAIDAKLYDLKVAAPARVLKYDHKKGLVDVQPCFKRTYPDGAVVDPAPIYNVPVQMPRSGKAGIHIPIKKGDYVQLIFQDRSIDKWISSGGTVDPEDTRKHDASDAVAIPGLFPANQPMEVSDPEDMVLKNDSVEIILKKNGKLKISNGSNELIAALVELAEAVKNEHGAAAAAYGKIRSFA